MNKRQYLIVDDEVFNRTFMTAVFSEEASISTACDGREALEMLVDKDFDVIICDVQMPLLNGIDLFKTIKRDYAEISEKFIFCTGNANNDFRQFCSKYEIPFCEKPIELHVLKETVNRITGCKV